MRRGLALDAPEHPRTRAYCDFLLAVAYSGYPAQITAIWALVPTWKAETPPKASDGEQAREAEDAFFWVTHYERGFWDMTMSG